MVGSERPWAAKKQGETPRLPCRAKVLTTPPRTAVERAGCRPVSHGVFYRLQKYSDLRYDRSVLEKEASRNRIIARRLVGSLCEVASTIVSALGVPRLVSSFRALSLANF